MSQNIGDPCADDPDCQSGLICQDGLCASQEACINGVCNNRPQNLYVCSADPTLGGMDCEVVGGEFNEECATIDGVNNPNAFKGNGQSCTTDQDCFTDGSTDWVCQSGYCVDPDILSGSEACFTTLAGCKAGCNGQPSAIAMKARAKRQSDTLLIVGSILGGLILLFILWRFVFKQKNYY